MSSDGKPRKRETLRGKNGVYKRGNVWLAVVEGPKDPKTGRRRRVWLRERFATRKAAEAARDRERDLIRGGVGVKPEKLTVGDVVTRYIDHRVAIGKVAEKAAERYRQLLRLNIQPHIGSLKIRSLHKSHVTEMITQLLAGGRQPRMDGAPREKPGLSATSVHHVHMLLKSALDWAVSVDIAIRNAADLEDGPQRAKSEADALTAEEILKILEAAHGSRWEPIVTFVLATGIRRGEAAALRRDCVQLTDDDRGTATIRASFSETKSGVTLKGTKTGKVRLVPLTALAVAALKLQALMRARDEFSAEGAYQDQGFVFADQFGQAFKPFTFTEEFRKIARKAGVNKRLHDLRHTAVSNLLAAGADVVTVAAIAGHSSVQTTLNTYAHQLEGMKEQAMDKLDERLRAAMDRARKERDTK